MFARAPMLFACLVAAAMTASADVGVSLTTHETPDGPATTSISTCALYVRAVGLLAPTGTLVVMQGTTEVTSAPYQGTLNGEGLYDTLAGPIDIGGTYSGLHILVRYDDASFPSLAGSPFDVTADCAPALASCVVSSFLPPIGTPGHTLPSGMQRFQHGQAIPVKIRAHCDGGAPYQTPTVHLMPLGGSEQDATTRSAAYTAHEMRGMGHHWHYVLDTRPLDAGAWKLRVDVGDATEHAVWIDLS